MSSSAVGSDACSNSSIAVLDPDEIFISCLTASLVPLYRGSQGIQLLHKVEFLAVLDPSQSLCKVLEACDSTAQGLSLDSGSSPDWRPIVTRKEGFFHYGTVRLYIPTVICEKVATYAAVICQKESSSNVRRLLFSKVDAEELGSLLKAGTFVDTVFSLDPYDYQQHAGRLIAKKIDH
ncbi:protein NEN1-like [Neltuma alba]|uniref:protein NEN1-like n=1 Tax=Neltuma alba TaxID=207710 RepID=UPI0010A55BEE|nr:protein NEN1-like [Prosopis alba]XP_028805890.1 protein NEN1-like [Prosopis alba]